MIKGKRCTVSGTAVRDAYNGLIISDPIVSDASGSVFVLVIKDNAKHDNIYRVNIDSITINPDLFFIGNKS